jgi:vitamin B12 transporter
MEGFVITGTPVPRTAGTVASHVSILDGEELRSRGVTRIAEALSEVPGLAVVQGGSYGSVTTTYFRGAESDHMKVLVDGVEMNQAGGAFDFAGLSMADVERIEVVRGPASAFYGSDAMAGVIHVITRRGKGPLQGSVSVGGGSFGRIMWGGDVHGGGERAGYSLSLSREETDGILAFNNRFENTVFSGKVFGSPDRKTRVEVAGRYSDRTYHFPTDGSGNVVDRNAFTFGEEKAFTAEVGRLVHDRLEVLATLRRYSWDGGSDDRSDGPADTLGYYGYVSSDSFRRTVGDFRLNLAPWSGSVLSAGFELEKETQTSDSESLSQWGPTEGKDRFERWNRGYYAHLLTEGSAWSGHVGVRLDDNEQYGEFLTYQAGASYQILSSGTLVRASLGRGLKEPGFFETASSGFSVGNPDLNPERSQVWEVGVDQSLPRTGATASLTWFNQSLRDLIQYTFTSPEPGGPNYFNVAEARVRGVELDVRVPLRAVDLTASYTLLDSEVLDAGFDEGDGATFVEGSELIRRPRHQANLGATYRRGRLALSGNTRWVGARPDRDYSAWPASPVELGSFVVFNLGADLDLVSRDGGRPGIGLQLRGENLLDSDYQEVFGFTAPGRALLVGMRMNVGG